MFLIIGFNHKWIILYNTHELNPAKFLGVILKESIMAKNFNPADVASVKINFNIAPAITSEAGLAFLIRRNARRIRRENRTL